MGEKTEKPTPKKLRDARKEGQIPRSRVLTAGCVVCSTLAVLGSSAPAAAARLGNWTERLFLEQAFTPTLASDALMLLGHLTLPPLAAAFTSALLVGVFTAGLEFHAEGVQLKWDRLNPVAGLKRLFTLERLIEPLRAVLLLVALSLWFWIDAPEALGELLRAVRAAGGVPLLVVLELLSATALRASGLLILLGVADYAWERWQHVKRLRMSREDQKREHKDSEGDPQHKAQRKSLHRQLASGGPARGLQKATAVVVNPTHIAVALRYAPDECDAPYLVAKGREGDAFALRREATRLGLPVVKDIPLARSLIHFDVGEQVPEELYRAAAAVLKVAMESRETDERPRSHRS